MQDCNIDCNSPPGVRPVTDPSASSNVSFLEGRTSPCPSKGWASGFWALFGYTVAQTDSQQGKEFKAEALQNATTKFPITSSVWSGTRITIPQENISQGEQQAVE